MSTDYKRFKDLAAGLQSCALVLAVVVGGLWAAFRYDTLLERERAQQELFSQAQVNIEVTAREEILPKTGESVIVATVKVTNNGKRNADLNYRYKDLATFGVTPVSFDPDGGTPVFGDRRPQPFRWERRVLRSNETDLYTFPVKVFGTGMYLLDFTVPLSNTELVEHAKAVGVKPEDVPYGSVFWQGSTTINVKGRSRNT